MPCWQNLSGFLNNLKLLIYHQIRLPVLSLSHSWYQRRIEWTWNLSVFNGLTINWRAQVINWASMPFNFHTSLQEWVVSNRWAKITGIGNLRNRTYRVLSVTKCLVCWGDALHMWFMFHLSWQSSHWSYSVWDSTNIYEQAIAQKDYSIGKCFKEHRPRIGQDHSVWETLGASMIHHSLLSTIWMTIQVSVDEPCRPAFAEA